MIPASPFMGEACATNTLTYYTSFQRPFSGWEVQRVYGLKHRWQWRAFTPGRGSVTGTAFSEAVARARAKRAHEELTA